MLSPTSNKLKKRSGYIAERSKLNFAQIIIFGGLGLGLGLGLVSILLGTLSRYINNVHPTLL